MEETMDVAVAAAQVVLEVGNYNGDLFHAFLEKTFYFTLT